MKKFLMIFWGVIFSLGLSNNINALTINYNDFQDLSQFTLNGATGSISNPVYFNGAYVLRLTNNYDQRGSAFLTNSITISSDYSFSTFFSFQITHSARKYSWIEKGADGLTFTIQTNSANVGGGGGSLGYGGIQNSLAIEYDTYYNYWKDPNGNHIGIDLNGNIQSKATKNIFPDFNNGQIWYTWIDYNGTTDTLEVRISQENTRPNDPDLSYLVDLGTIFGTNVAYVGFTSGTGDSMGWHDIREWIFVDNYSPINNVPEPCTLLLIGSGLIGVIGIRKRMKNNNTSPLKF
ncbi:hypothetical protein JCM12298_03340 [Desulfothermus naphthae]